MTVLAGCWTADAPALSCHAMLAAQAGYASGGAVVAASGDMASGIALTPLLPEDGCDAAIAGNPRGDLLCADVRLDDRAALGASLGIASGEIGRMSDRALVLRALERWGREALDRIDGDFALAFWDAARREVTLARDFSGQKPLFFHRRAGLFAWASMPRGLHALAQIPAAPDLGQLARFLSLAGEADDRSFFEGLVKVAPGEAISFDGTALRRTRIWHPPTRGVRFARDAEYVDALRERLDAAVASRLRCTTGAIGAQLSSGLDSSAVAASAARLLAPDPLTAYTAVPRLGFAQAAGVQNYDEGPLAATLAARYPNLRHRLVRSDGQSPLDRMAHDAALFERPILNPVNMVWIAQILDAARGDGVRVLLTGARGNMGFSYNGVMLLPQLLARGEAGAMLGAARAMAAQGTRWATIGAAALGPFMPESLWRLALRMGRRAERPRPPRDSVSTRAAALRGVDYGNYTKGWLGGWGIAVRDPTSDRRLVDFCLAVPEEQFLRGGIQRSLARRAIADRIPAEILDAPRKGYQAADWFEGLAGARDAVAAELDHARARPDLARLVDLAQLDRLVAHWPERWDDPALRHPYRLTLMRQLAALSFARHAGKGSA